MKLLAIIPILCAAYVIYQVWFKRPEMGVGFKIAWSVVAVLFSVFTAAFYYLRNRD